MIFTGKIPAFFGRSGDMCVLQKPLGDIGKIGMYALLFVVIIIKDSFSIIIVIITSYCCYLGFYIVPL